MCMKNKESQFYYITLFKIEGHEKWRCHTGKFLTDFEREIKSCTGKVPKVTAKKVYKLSRADGNLIT